jgi:hypothetical protein
LDFFLLFPMYGSALKRDVLMVSREWGGGLGRRRVVYWRVRVKDPDSHKNVRGGRRGIRARGFGLEKTVPKLREMDSATAFMSSSLAELLLH